MQWYLCLPLMRKMMCSPASVLVSGAYDRTVALWDVKGLYRTLVLKVTAFEHSYRER